MKRRFFLALRGLAVMVLLWCLAKWTPTRFHIMSDLIFAAAVVVGACVGLLFAGFRIGRAQTRGPAVVALVGVGVVYGVYFLLFRDSVLLLRVLPVSSVPILGDPSPWLASLAAGVLLAQRSVPAARRSVIAVLVVAMGWHGPVSVLARTPPEVSNEWSQGVCFQTARATCGPAALATLLRHHGVQTNEAEMARLCLTGEEGTHLTGLYRGLRLRAPEGLTPRAASLSVQSLRDRPERLPAVVSLMLTRELAAPTRATPSSGAGRSA